VLGTASQQQGMPFRMVLGVHTYTCLLCWGFTPTFGYRGHCTFDFHSQKPVWTLSTAGKCRCAHYAAHKSHANMLCSRQVPMYQALYVHTLCSQHKQCISAHSSTSKCQCMRTQPVQVLPLRS
jgi:hypothetical protein